jgi:hypothetical protein
VSVPYAAADAPADIGGRPEGSRPGTGPPGPAQHQLRPVVVQHSGAEPVASIGADYGGWFTFALTATQAAQIIMPHDERRARAVIIVQSTGGTVWVGSKPQTQASPVLGGNLPPGTFELKNKQELWLAPDGTHTATVTVLIERYEGTR